MILLNNSIMISNHIWMSLNNYYYPRWMNLMNIRKQ